MKDCDGTINKLTRLLVAGGLKFDERVRVVQEDWWEVCCGVWMGVEGDNLGAVGTCG